jgi:hypothetical protein
MDIRDEIDQIVKKYKLQSHVFIGCDGEVHYVKWFGKEEHLMKMLRSVRKDIKKYFADKEN